jgi:hypothetical protein
MPMAIPPRTTSLHPADPGHAYIPPGAGKPWWTSLRPWPPGMRFEDVDDIALAFERLTDTVRLGPPPAPLGGYGCSARMAEESRFAEPEIAA